MTGSVTRAGAAACVVAAACAVGQGAGAAETPERFRVKSFADVMAPTTIFHLEIRDYARARAAYRATPRWKLWWEGAGRRLISGMIRSEGDEEFTAALRSFAEAVKFPTGKVAFAIEGPDPADEFGMPMSVFLAEVGDMAGEFTGLVKQLWGAGLVEGGGTVIQRVRFEEADDLLIGSKGGLVIGGFGRTGLNGLLSRFAERPRRNLSRNPVYKLAKSRALKGAHFMAFTNFAEIWRMLAMEFDGDEWLSVERTGLPQLAATAFSGRFTPEGVVDKISFILSGRARGMWKLMRPEPLSRKAWRLLPRFTSGFVAMKLPERTQPFIQMLTAVDPTLADDFLEPFRDFREETTVNVESDLLRLTTGEFTVVFLEDAAEARAPEPDGMNMGPERTLRNMVLLAELKNPARARAAMDRMAAIDLDGERLGRKRRFGGLDGWEIGDDLSGRLFVSGSDGIGMVALSPEPLVRIGEHVTKRAPGLVGSEEFRKATAWIPDDTGFAAYSNVSKVLKGFHALMASETEAMADRPVDLPKADELMADLTPLTACVHIEKPGFAFEVRSPDGFWPFYMQLVAHCIWRFEEEPMQERERARAEGLPPVPAGADPELAKAYADLRWLLARVKTPQLRIVVLENSLPQFAGTPYERPIEQALSPEKTARMAPAYRKTMATVAKLKSPDFRIRFLSRSRPQFAGTRYKPMIDAMIHREAGRAQTPPAAATPADAAAAKAFSALMDRRARIKTWQQWTAELERAKPSFAGTRYARIVDAMIARRRNMAMAAEYEAVVATAPRFGKGPRGIDQTIEYLENRKPRFAGTLYEPMIDRMIERARAELNRPEPADDEDDVF
jgi:hypothetical protein